MTWTTLNFAFGAVLTSSQMNQLYANFQGYANSDAGSPNAVIDNSSATSDIALGLNQIAILKLAAVSSVQMHVATSDYQEYEITFYATAEDVTSNAAAVVIYPNNAGDTGNMYYQFLSAANASVSAASATSNAMVLALGNLRSMRARVGTGYSGAVKHGLTKASVVYGATTMLQEFLTAWTRTTSAWVSLGTFGTSRNVTGLLTIQRVA